MCLSHEFVFIRGCLLGLSIRLEQETKVKIPRLGVYACKCLVYAARKSKIQPTLGGGKSKLCVSSISRRKILQGFGEF